MGGMALASEAFGPLRIEARVPVPQTWGCGSK